MADEQHEVRSISWGEVFGFTQIFKSFRMAINLGSLFLALGALVLLFVGGTVLDEVWSISSSGFVEEGEIYSHYRLGDRQFDEAREQWLDQRADGAAGLVVASEQQRRNLTNFLGLWSPQSQEYRKAFGDKLQDANKDAFKSSDAKKLAEDESWSELLSRAEKQLDGEIEKVENLLESAYDDAEKAVEKLSGEERDEAREQLERSERKARQAIARRRAQFAEAVQGIRGGQIFASLLEYEWNVIVNGLRAVRYGNITTGLAEYRRTQDAGDVQPVAAGGVLGAPMRNLQVEPQQEYGFLFWVLMGFNGIAWLITEHWLYAVLLLAWGLALWALFGGAVYRIAALQATRQEKISAAQGLKFAASRFFSFFTAPLLPIAIILALGGLMALGGLLGNLWGFGAALIGLLMFLALILGLVVAFLVIGLLGGFKLMYPTIAVEGSDSFDAISRSFSYIFARPWRAILYGAVALFYGTFCYLFVRLFAYLALECTRTFVKWGVWQGGQSVGGYDKIAAIWSAPSYANLVPPFSWSAMSSWEQIGAFFIWVYVSLIAAMVFAFLLTFCASSGTVIYLLLRRKVDATDLDDIYVEEIDEEPLPEPVSTPPAEGEGDNDQADAEDASSEDADEQAPEQEDSGEQDDEENA